MNIAIPIIATGKYIKYVPELIKGINEFFLPKHRKWIYVFTDFQGEIEGAMIVYEEYKPWPHGTLDRYKIFYNYFHSQQLNFDFLYYFDADMKVVDFVGEEIFGKLVVTRHPGFYNKKPEQFELDTKFLAKSYVNPNLIKQYYCGGFNGGADYLQMAGTIKKWSEIDGKYQHIPIYHDESYLQKYCYLNPPDVILSPEYCMPETTRERRVYGITHLQPKIIAITK